MWDFIAETTFPTQNVTILRNRKTGLCMDYTNKFMDGETIISAQCSNSCNQRWVVTYSARPANTVHAKPPTPLAKAAPKHPNRLLCWILTQPASHDPKALNVNSTWGQDCDILLFFSTAPYPGLDIVVVPTDKEESRSLLMHKTQFAWDYVYKNYINKADWFFKADDDACENNF
jgi:hypothetical protein